MLVVTSWLQEYLAKKLTPAQMAEAMERAAIEVEGIGKHGKDSVIDVSTAANRSDLLSYIGIAREVAAHTNTKVVFKATGSLPSQPKGHYFEVKDKQLVPHYALAKLHLQKPVGSSPAWLAERLELSGVRAINVVVDVTNYIMLAYGQPLHAFDADKIKGKMTIRLARRGERLRTLDGVVRELLPSDIVIADESGVIDLAGIMGGASTEISSSTKTVYLTTTNFDGVHVRKTSKRLGHRTEASARFERGLPVELLPPAAMAAQKLLDELLGVGVEGVQREQNHKPQAVSIKVSPEKLSRLAGVAITAPQIISSLKKLGFSVKNGHVLLSVTPPYWRQDVTLEEDVFEEVIKLVGLGKIPATLPPYQLSSAKADTRWPKIWRVRELLAGLGAFEVTNYPFVSEKGLAQQGFKPTDLLKLANPRSPEQAYMRINLLDGLLGALANNRLYTDSFNLFEIGRIFQPSGKQLPNEQLHLAVAVKDDARAYQLAKGLLDNVTDMLRVDLKLQPSSVAGALHPTLQAKLLIAGEPAGMIGQLHPALAAQHKLKGAAYWELSLDAMLEAAHVAVAKPISKFEPVKRDVTLWLERKVTWAHLQPVLESIPGVQASYGSEYYEPKRPDQRALTLHLEIGSAEGNLTEAEADSRQAKLVTLLGKRFGARL